MRRVPVPGLVLFEILGPLQQSAVGAHADRCESGALLTQNRDELRIGLQHGGGGEAVIEELAHDRHRHRRSHVEARARAVGGNVGVFRRRGRAADQPAVLRVFDKCFDVEAGGFAHIGPCALGQKFSVL